MAFRLDPSDERWTALVDSIPEANIFHHPGWVNLLAEYYGYRPFVIALFDSRDRLSAGLPFLDVNSPLTGKRWVSLPFTDYCSPLSIEPAALEMLSSELVDLSQSKKNPRIEVRWELPSNAAIQSAAQFVRHSLNLNQDIDAIKKSLHRTQRQNINTAEKNGVWIDWGRDLEHLQVYYYLHCLTRRRQGVPVQPWRFFELLLNRFIANGLGFILLAYKENNALLVGCFSIITKPFAISMQPQAI